MENNKFVTLRALTKKSILVEGKYKSLSVQSVLNTDKGYLAWVYYNMSKLTFTDDILKELFITPELQIKKPGKDPQKLKEWTFHFYYVVSDVKSAHYQIKNNKLDFKKKSIARSKGLDNDIRFSQKSLCWKNHGHTKKK